MGMHEMILITDYESGKQTNWKKKKKRKEEEKNIPIANNSTQPRCFQILFFSSSI
jgi:hypothetical protein